MLTEASRTESRI